MEKGDTLTISNDIIDFSGNIIFLKGQKVIISEVWKDNAHWSNVYDWWIPEKIHGFKLEKYGLSLEVDGDEHDGFDIVELKEITDNRQTDGDE